MDLSFTNKTWNFIESDENSISEISKELKISEIAARILVNRGIKTSEEASKFINSKLNNTIPEPLLVLDMDKGIKRVLEAINTKQQITILGDYDVDGITSTCLMIKYFKYIGVPVKFYIPNRFCDGYGISESSIEVIVQNKTELLITVDSGINSIEEIEKLNNLGIDTIVIDHHTQTTPDLPNAIAVINPNRIDQKEIGHSYIKNLSAAGVAFLFLIALQRELRNLGFFKNLKEPNLIELTDIVSLGALCDVMELKGINRALLKCTLNKNQYSKGILSLMNLFNIQKINSPEDLSFFIGPAINSAGRVGDPHIALHLLLEESEERSQKLANKLYELNKERKSIETKVLAEAINIINEHNLSTNPGICVFDNNWSQGVIGIIAGKIKDKFQKPAFVITFDQNGQGKGSARSLKGIHLGNFLEKAKSNNLITKGGGHELAGGFSIEKEKISNFISFINSEIAENFHNSINIDYCISPFSSLDDMAISLRPIEPFGKGMEKPIFCLKRVKIKYSKPTSSGNHIMFNFSNEFDKGNIKSILFNIKSKSEIIKQIEDNKFELFDIVGSISYNEQFGSSLVIDDLRLSIL